MAWKREYDVLLIDMRTGHCSDVCYSSMPCQLLWRVVGALLVFVLDQRRLVHLFVSYTALRGQRACCASRGAHYVL